MPEKPVILMILDGWGIAPPGPYNAAYVAKTPYLDSYFARCPHCELEASGSAVGLPEGQMGNSEVGHLNIGSGRIIYQELTRISKAISDGTFFKNPVLVEVMRRAAADGKALHLLGLLSDGGVHSHISHLTALLRLAGQLGLSRVYLHAFLDGRDVGPKTALGYIEQIEEAMRALGVGSIATVSGRYYAMDRDQRWERIRQAYAALVSGEGERFANAAAGVHAAYERGVTDEIVPPIDRDGKDGRIVAGDGVIFFNFRPDRARQLTRALSEAEFTHFARPAGALPVHFACMTSYDATLAATVAFPPENHEDTLGRCWRRGACSSCALPKPKNTPMSLSFLTAA